MSGRGGADHTEHDPRETGPSDQHALVAIGAELAAIRQELTLIRRALTDDAPAADDSAEGEDGPAWTCRCGAAFDSRAAARDHATETHNAPRDGWQDIISRE